MSLRLWPGVVGAALIVVSRYGVPLVMQDGELYEIAGPLAGSLIIVVWWTFFSRAPWLERLIALVLMAAAAAATTLVVHPSIAGGMMGRMVFVYAVPSTLGLAFVAWAWATRNLTGPSRLLTMAAAIAVGCGVWALFRTGGVSGGSMADLHWRWTPTPEERLLAKERDVPEKEAAAPSVAAPAAPAGEPPATAAGPIEKPPAAAPGTASDPAAAKVDVSWPGFRGARRDGVLPGRRIETDWAAHPPVEVWRRPIGPGWSSFAVAADLVYTQEQRGEQEVVSCYSLGTGRLVWRHGDPVRFYESNGGAGPRATPTVHGGRVYTLGATGILNALDARTGAVAWSRNAAADTAAAMPGWGFTASPLVVEDAIVVATSGRLASYDIATGSPRWTHTTGGGGYSSPHLVTIDGVAQILLLTGNGATSVAPADGARLWQHVWEVGVAIVQPGLAGEHDILLGLGDSMGGQGMRRLAVARTPGGWTVEERWTTRGLKPYFNDFVVHEGHAFGFDGTILACINLGDGARTWKAGRYGNGQLLLLPDQDLLLVLAEDGEVALVGATPDKFIEMTRFKAIDGKTWNHPVLVGNLLLVRNGEEMAAFRLGITNLDRRGKY
jgi:outer membrane protein assembly factor BamB